MQVHSGSSRYLHKRLWKFSLMDGNQFTKSNGHRGHFASKIPVSHLLSILNCSISEFSLLHRLHQNGSFGLWKDLGEPWESYAGSDTFVWSTARDVSYLVASAQFKVNSNKEQTDVSFRCSNGCTTSCITAASVASKISCKGRAAFSQR